VIAVSVSRRRRSSSSTPLVAVSDSSAADAIRLHHLKLLASNPDASLDCYQRIFGAQHLPQLDHSDDNGTRYAVVIAIPGLPAPLELRSAPGAATAMGGCGPINHAVESTEARHAWAPHLDSLTVEHVSASASPTYQPAASKTSPCPRAIPNLTTYGAIRHQCNTRTTVNIARALPTRRSTVARRRACETVGDGSQCRIKPAGQSRHRWLGWPNRGIVSKVSACTVSRRKLRRSPDAFPSP
jgi:hypothetical protein